MKNADTPPLAVGEIQSLVLRDATGAYVLHVVITFADGGKGRHFLRKILWDKSTRILTLSSAGAQKGEADAVQTSLGFTYRGLEKLSAPPQLLRPFLTLAPAFAAGAPLRAAEQLGDTGPSAPNHWEDAFRLDTAHAVLSLHADDLQVLQQVLADLCGLAPLPAAPWKPPDVSLHALWGQRWGTRENQQVHFGFRDGLSKVGIKGWTDRNGAVGTPLHAPGEFLLGHGNNHGYNTWALASSAEDARTFFRNGSFGILRKMEQDVSAFEAWVAAQAQALIGKQAAYDLPPDAPQLGTDPEAWRNYIKGKLCGRLPSGEGLLPINSYAGNDPVHGEFNYENDPSGTACPFGAHIRRMNPRPVATQREDGVVHIRQRTLLRRGRPYGVPSAESPDPQEQGLLGLFFCASIEDQFEHLLGQWAERPVLGAADAGSAKDPLIGQHENPHTRFDIPLPCGQSLTLSDFHAFVRTRGTVYAFHPSLSGLKLLLDNADFLTEPDEVLGP